MSMIISRPLSFISKVDKLSKNSYHSILISGSLGSMTPTHPPSSVLEPPKETIFQDKLDNITNETCIDLKTPRESSRTQHSDPEELKSPRGDRDETKAKEFSKAESTGSGASTVVPIPSSTTPVGAGQASEKERLKLQGFTIHFRDFCSEGFVWREEKLWRAFQQAIVPKTNFTGYPVRIALDKNLHI